jgi:hypothetical protein
MELCLSAALTKISFDCKGPNESRTVYTSRFNHNLTRPTSSTTTQVQIVSFALYHTIKRPMLSTSQVLMQRMPISLLTYHTRSPSPQENITCLTEIPRYSPKRTYTRKWLKYEYYYYQTEHSPRPETVLLSSDRQNLCSLGLECDHRAPKRKQSIPHLTHHPHLNTPQHHRTPEPQASCSIYRAVLLCTQSVPRTVR